MDIKISKNNLKYGVVVCGGADLQSLVSIANKIGYNSGIYGWNWNAYRLTTETGGEVVIVIGQRNMPWDSVRHYIDIDKWLALRDSCKSYDEMKQFTEKLATAIYKAYASENWN